MRRIAVIVVAALVVTGCQHRPEKMSAGNTQPTAEPDEVIVPLPKAKPGEVVTATRTRFPLFESFKPDQSALERLLTDPQGAQPWMRGPKTPPLNVQALGLKGRLSLADFGGTKIEWGTHVVVEDMHGNVFAFCSSQRWNRTGDAYVDDFFLGGTKPDKQLVRVEEGTPAYKFLQALVWHFANDPRYRASEATRQQVKEMLHASDAHFAELLTPPAWP